PSGSERQTYSTNRFHATRHPANTAKTIAKQRIHRRVENTGKRAANATARHRTAGKTPPQTNTRACRNHGE
ncbi:hypothetical protein ACTQZJ_07570, partial [Bifidobacterium catenulatum]|uniref:hypothetical protein n=1 Tax=Bifidobacterium catenulatum TaxID=1686 RepID=UPI003F8D9284